MKLVCYGLGIILLIIAGMYFVTPADTLPSFFPSHAAGVMRVHVKHGIVAGALGIVFMMAGSRMGRKS